MDGPIQLRYRLDIETMGSAERLDHRADVRPVLQSAAGVIGAFMVAGSIWMVWIEGFTLLFIPRFLVGTGFLFQLWPLLAPIVTRRHALHPQLGMWTLIKVDENEVFYSLESQEAVSLPWSLVKHGIIGRNGILLKVSRHGKVWLPFESLQPPATKDHLIRIVRGRVRGLRDERPGTSLTE